MSSSILVASLFQKVSRSTDLLFGIRAKAVIKRNEIKHVI